MADHAGRDRRQSRAVGVVVAEIVELHAAAITALFHLGLNDANKWTGNVPSSIAMLNAGRDSTLPGVL